MYTLKAFATNSLFIKNIPNTVSAIGEISTQSLTYARNKGYYSSNLDTNIDLITFTSDKSGAPYVLSQDLVDQIISICNFIYNAATASGAQLYADVLLDNLLNTFDTIANTFNCGNIITAGTVSIPEWISFSSLNTAEIGDNSQIKIWFCDDSFQIEYDYYEIVVVPPLTPLDTFFTNTTNILNVLNSNVLTVVMENIQTAKNKYPESVIIASDYNFNDPINIGNLIPTAWYLIIYGIAGTDVDVMKNELVNYIMSNTTHTQPQWTLLFPDIFKNTEFIIVPNWDQYSIPNMTLQAGIYSPNAVMSKALTLLTNSVNAYPAMHITANADIVAQPYKSLSLFTIGNINNTNNIYNITNMYPDFINVPSTSIDFARMSQNTQNFANLLVTMLVIAETMTKFSTIPTGMTKVTRNNILYLVSKFNNIDYLVASKGSF